MYTELYIRTHSNVLRVCLKDYNEEYITCTGKFEAPKEGEDIEIQGRYVEHEKYGIQFDASSIEKLKPDNMGAAKTVLDELRHKGFGEKSVEKILDYFGLRILDVLRRNGQKKLKMFLVFAKALRRNYLIHYLVKVYYPI